MPMDADYGFNRESMGSRERRKKEQLKLEELDAIVKQLQQEVEQLKIDQAMLELKVQQNS